jgi:hypothetical protein
VDRVLDTGVDQVTVRTRRGVETGREVSGHYWVGVVGDRLMTIVSHGGAKPAPGTPIVGYVKDMPSDLLTTMTTGLEPRIKAAFLPTMIETKDFKSDGDMGLGAAAIASGGALMFALVALVGFLAPGRHGALKALAASGVPLAEAGATIADDVADRRYLRLKNYRLTRGYAVKEGVWFDVKPLRDLLWAYPTVTQNKIYGIIPTTKSYSVEMVFKGGAKISERIGKDKGADVMAFLGQHAPWAFLGYDDRLASAIGAQRPQIEAIVAERHATVTAAGPSPDPASPAG